jgi:hypothetical protein
VIGVLRLLAFFPLVFVGRLRGVERRTMARLKDAGATTAERAILLEAGGFATNLVYTRLERAHVLRQAGNDRYYLDAAVYDAFTGRRRRRALTVVVVVLGMLGLTYYGGLFS